MNANPKPSSGAGVDYLGNALREPVNGNDDAESGVIYRGCAGVDDQLIYRNSVARLIDDEYLLVADFDAVRLIGKRHLDSKTRGGKTP